MTILKNKTMKRRSKLAQHHTWLAKRLDRPKDERAPLRELTYLERKARLARIKKDGLTPEDVWSLYCSGDPIKWTAHWFNLPVSQVRALQDSPNRGKPWTAAQKRELSIALGGFGIDADAAEAAE